MSKQINKETSWKKSTRNLCVPMPGHVWTPSIFRSDNAFPVPNFSRRRKKQKIDTPKSMQQKILVATPLAIC